MKCLKLDVRNFDEVEKVINSLDSNWKKIDILINNAGLSRGLDKIHEGKKEDWDEMIDTNVKGLVFEKLLYEVVKSGVILLKKQSPTEIHNTLENRASLLPDEHKRFISPHTYKTGITPELMNVRNKLSRQIKNTL